MKPSKFFLNSKLHKDNRISSCSSYNTEYIIYFCLFCKSKKAGICLQFFVSEMPYDVRASSDKDAELSNIATYNSEKLMARPAPVSDHAWEDR